MPVNWVCMELMRSSWTMPSWCGRRPDEHQTEFRADLGRHSHTARLAAWISPMNDVQLGVDPHSGYHGFQLAAEYGASTRASMCEVEDDI